MARAAGSPTTVTTVLAASGTVAVLLQSLVVPLIPSIPAALGTDVVGGSWVLTASLLAGAIAQPIVGRCGDIYGERRMLVFCLAAAIVGAVISALSLSLGPMIVGRALQGMGMGIIPMGLSLLRRLLPADRLPAAVGTLGATMGLGGALGIPVSAVVLAWFSWPWLFWFAAVCAALCLVLVLALIPASDTGPVRTRLDVPGAVGFGLAIGALLVAITQGAAWGWTSPAFLALLGGSILLLAGWCGYEWIRPAPLVDIRLALTPSVFWANLAGIAMGFSMMFVVIVLPLQIVAPSSVSYGLGLSEFDIGWIMLPGGLAMMLAGPASARISQTWGARTTLQLGAALVAVGYALALLPAHAVILMVSAVIVYCGFGLSFAALPLIIMAGTPTDRTAAANGLNALMRSIGMTLAATVASVVLATERILVDGIDLASPAAVTTTLLIGIGSGALGIATAIGIPGHRRINQEEGVK
ncbi:MFS transporter [Microbacterium sp. NPDC055910]|uniref:MFS transporter n=1 Tax=Microbacterium sp. NPDC055910 TaxID=3345659 RepID=UPI0035DF3B06